MQRFNSIFWKRKALQAGQLESQQWTTKKKKKFFAKILKIKQLFFLKSNLENFKIKFCEKKK